jgi:hypothetical protein
MRQDGLRGGGPIPIVTSEVSFGGLRAAAEDRLMTQTSNRLFDELARLMTDAANVAQGVRREASTAFRSQAERLINDLDLVRREDFDAVKEMASRARAENETLAARVAALEAEVAGLTGKAPKPAAEVTAEGGETAAKPKRAPRSPKPAEE